MPLGKDLPGPTNDAIILPGLKHHIVSGDDTPTHASPIKRGDSGGALNSDRLGILPFLPANSRLKTMSEFSEMLDGRLLRVERRNGFGMVPYTGRDYRVCLSL